MQLPMNPIPSDRFGYDHVTGVFSQEASTLNDWRPERLYDDAVDIGLAIRSLKTDKVARYYLADTVRDRENDITHWIFLPAQDAPQRSNMSIMRTKVILFND